MAVVEVGWRVRAGYIGDMRCTRSLPSLTNSLFPDEMDLCSILDRSSDATAMRARTQSDSDSIAPLWSRDGIETDVVRHVAYLGRVKQSVLRCSAEDPLMLVLPEMWMEDVKLLKKMAESILETPDVTRAVYFSRPSVAWTVSNGCSTALVADTGHTHSTVAAVLDGYALRRSVSSTEAMSGRAATQNLQQSLAVPVSLQNTYFPHLLSQRGASAAVEDVVNEVKESVCYVAERAPHGKRPLSSSANRGEDDDKKESLILLPDGQEVRVHGSQLWKPYELFFSGAREEMQRSSVLGTGAAGVPSQKRGVCLAGMIDACRSSVDVEIRASAFPLLLCGQTARARGFSRRLVSDLRLVDSTFYRTECANAVQLSDHGDGAWVGSSLIAGSAALSTFWITRAELEEEGESVLHRKLYM